MKNLLKLLPFLVIAIVLKSCTTEPNDNEVFDALVELPTQYSLNQTDCTNDLPKTRFINNGSINFNLHLLRDDGSIVIAIPNIEPGTTTDWNTFDVGEVLFSVTNSTPMISDEKVELVMDTCMAYEIVIGADNQITSYFPVTL